mmetsp:Transcript_30623/g.40464  ORF Transcript_30623/g.40464 Transcript_30623/m.40464 type:complete len:133 (+) Transcript_30623:2-400(+)
MTQSNQQLFPMPAMKQRIKLSTPHSQASLSKMRHQSSEVSFAPFRRGSTTKSDITEVKKPISPPVDWAHSPLPSHNTLISPGTPASEDVFFPPNTPPKSLGSSTRALQVSADIQMSKSKLQGTPENIARKHH